MSFKTSFIAVLAILGIGIVPQFLTADDSVLLMRSYHNMIAKYEGRTDGTLAVPHYRLAMIYAGQQNRDRAIAHFGLALKNAVPKQVPSIASDFANYLLSIEDFHRAEMILRQALNQSPRNEEIIKTLARCLVLQDKMMEGLRYFKQVYSEAEAKEQIAAIYREKGNSEMVAAMGKKWGTANSEPVYVAANPKSAVFPTPKPTAVSETKPYSAAPSPIAIAVTAPKPMVISEKKSAQGVLPPPIAVTAVPSKPEVFETRIPIPLPKRIRPEPMRPESIASITPKNTPAPTPPVPMLPPAPLPMVASKQVQKSAGNFELTNPIRLAVKPVQKAEENFALVNPIKLAVQPVQPVKVQKAPSESAHVRKHYVVNAAGSSDLNDLFSLVQPVVATVPVRDVR